MEASDDPYGVFDEEKKWEQDYEDVNPEEIASRLKQPWARALLLQDYEQASADGRHRDQLIHYSFYVGLVVLGLILNLGWQMWSSASYLALVLVLVIGTSLYLILYVWSLSAKNSRDASWDRRSEIEDIVKLVDLDLLRSNDSKFKRLKRREEGHYGLPGKEGIERSSVGRFIVLFHLYIAVLFGVCACLVGGWWIWISLSLS